MSTISERVTPHRRRIGTRGVPCKRTALIHMAEHFNVVYLVLAVQATLYARTKRGTVRWKVVYIRAYYVPRPYAHSYLILAIRKIIFVQGYESLHGIAQC